MINKIKKLLRRCFYSTYCVNLLNGATDVVELKININRLTGEADYKAVVHTAGIPGNSINSMSIFNGAIKQDGKTDFIVPINRIFFFLYGEHNERRTSI